MHGKELRRGILSALIAVLIFATAITGYAWLKTDRGADFRLGADNTPDISIKTASWKNGAYQWDTNWIPVQPNHRNDPTEPFGGALDVDQTNTGMTAEEITGTLRVNCQFGEITNLTRLDESNNVWFCLRIHEEEGMNIKNLRIHYDAVRPYQFFGAFWPEGAGKVEDIYPVDNYPGISKAVHPKADVVKAQLAKIDQSVMKTLMEVSIPEANSFITNVPPENYFGTPRGMDPQMDYVRLATDQQGGYSGTATPEDLDGHYYYVYFRARPHLDGYFKFVQNLYEYMPCYLTFNDLTVSVDVVKKPQEPAKP